MALMRLVLLACSALVPALAAKAAPIVYTFTWNVTGTVEYAPLIEVSPFTERFSITVDASTADVEQRPSGNYFNDPAGGLNGTLSGLGRSAGIAGLQVRREVESAGSFLTLALTGATSSDPRFTILSVYERYANVPGLASYDLRSGFGPVNGIAGIGFNPGVDLGLLAPTLSGTTAPEAVSFTATPGSGSAIAYRFDWTQSGVETVVTHRPPLVLSNEVISLTLTADTTDVDRRSSGNYFNDPAPSGLTATLSGLGRSVTLPNGYLVRTAFASQLGAIQLAETGYLDEGDPVLSVHDLYAHTPGLEGYDLSSSFGPLAALESLPLTLGRGLDLAPLLDVDASFSGSFDNVVFEAQLLPVSEPETLLMWSLGLLVVLARQRQGALQAA